MDAHTKETARDVVVAEYRRLAETYDVRWSFYIGATTRETAARLQLRPADRLLDVGCGTGVLLGRLSDTHAGAHLFGVDPVPEMLAVARRRLPPSIDVRQGWAEALPFGAEQFDVVVSSNMFHYLPDPAAALGDMRRVLRPGGRLVVTDWCDDYLVCRACDLYLRLFSRAHFKTYSLAACIRLLGENGFAMLQRDRYKISWLWGLMTVTAAKPAA